MKAGQHSLDLNCGLVELFADPAAICRNRWNSALLPVPHPSAILAAIEAEHRRI
jgi:hypothetical protein